MSRASQPSVAGTSTSTLRQETFLHSCRRLRHTPSASALSGDNFSVPVTDCMPLATTVIRTDESPYRKAAAWPRKSRL